MVKTALYLTLIVLFANSVLAATIPLEAYPRREISGEELLARDSDAFLEERELLSSLYSRGDEMTDLQEREPFFFLAPLLMAARTAIQIGARVATRVGSRIAKHVVKHKIKKEVNKKRKRELDESEDELDLAAREYWDELIEREMEVVERELGGDSDDGGALLGREFSGGEELFLD